MNMAAFLLTQYFIFKKNSGYFGSIENLFLLSIPASSSDKETYYYKIVFFCKEKNNSPG